jgi:hypothetical protein
MGHEFWYRGHLEFKDQSAIDALRRNLEEDGYIGHEENPIEESDIIWSGRVATIDMRGSMPYSSFGIGSSMLGQYALHAAAGDVIALNVEDGYGERFVAGEEGRDLEDEEIDRLTEEYGWNPGA